MYWMGFEKEQLIELTFAGENRWTGPDPISEVQVYHNSLATLFRP